MYSVCSICVKYVQYYYMCTVCSVYVVQERKKKEMNKEVGILLPKKGAT